MNAYVETKIEKDERKITFWILTPIVLRKVAILYQPIIPDGSSVILDQLGVPSAERDFTFLEKGAVAMGTKLEKYDPVYPRIEMPGEADAKAEKQKQASEQKQQQKAVAKKKKKQQ